MSQDLRGPAFTGPAHSLTDQTLNRSPRENKMLLSIELSRERIRDMERRIADRHPDIVDLPSRKPMIAAARRLRHVLSSRSN
jgi:hypothetical protein